MTMPPNDKPLVVMRPLTRAEVELLKERSRQVAEIARRQSSMAAKTAGRP